MPYFNFVIFIAACIEQIFTFQLSRHDGLFLCTEDEIQVFSLGIYWNLYLWPILRTNSDAVGRKKPLMAALGFFVGQYHNTLY